MDNASGDSYIHLTIEFYTLYAATLINLTTATETTKRGHKDFATTL